jgi:ABC-2 type transport system permease protein
MTSASLLPAEHPAGDPSKSAQPGLSAPLPGKVLRRLFLTLFLRGRSSRGLQRDKAPKSIASKLALTLLFYALWGSMALLFFGQPVFTLSIYLHAMTFVFLGMFVASSAGEVLFNKEEADILMHRPVTPRALLWAKIGVLVQISLWLAVSFNLVGLLVGLVNSPRGWLFPLAHLVSIAIEALLCTGLVVLAYQLCLRWFGRERLEGLMTTVQVLVAVVAVLGGQLVPQLIGRVGGQLNVKVDAWWIALLPPAWFAGLDDVISGGETPGAALLAAVGLLVTAVVLWLAFGKLARDYATGLQTLNESVSPKIPRGSRRRWVSRFVEMPLVRWWFRDSITRASFLLTAAYLFRDRETKLRIYPGLAPMLVMPLIILLRPGGFGGSSSYGLAFAGVYLGIAPLLALNLLQFTQQWQAADLFRAAPMIGPAPLWHGARRAVLVCLTVPLVMLFALIAWILCRNFSQLLLLIPGVIALPIYAMVACIGSKAVPFSLPVEEAKSAGRGIVMLAAMMVGFAFAGLVSWSWSQGWFGWLILAESVLAATLYLSMRASLARSRWKPVEGES